MRPFVFRPQPALDIRRRQDEAARREVAAAELALLAAGQAVERAQGTIARASTQIGEILAGGDLGTLGWYRNWMVGLERELAKCRQLREERRVELNAAAARAQEARRKLRALERLKERAWGVWQQAARREEQKALDELAGLRFFANRLREQEDRR